MTEQELKDNIDKFLSPDYIAMVGRVINNIVIEDDQSNAFALIQLFVEALKQEGVKNSANKGILDFYNNNLITLKFIALPLLENKDVIHLLSNNFVNQFNIEDYNILEKFNYKLLNIILVSDRDDLKREVERNLLKNQEVIVSGGEINKICDWLKNYVSAVGLENRDTLLRAQYFSSLKNNNNVNSLEYNHLISLFQFYDILGIPSDSPEGLVEEPPVVVGGKLYIFRKGVLEPVNENKDFKKIIQSTNSSDSSDVLLESSNLLNSKSSDLALSSEPGLPLNGVALDISDLESALKNYSEGSLEHKALKQEISRLKAAELKQAQRSAGSQINAQK